MNEIYIILLAILLFLLYRYLTKIHYDNYVSYGSSTYELSIGNIYKLTKNQYKNNNELYVHIIDPNLMLVIMFKKHNCICDGLPRDIIFTNYSIKNQGEISLEKNSDCYPNGGLEPQYLVVVPFDETFSGYRANLEYEPTNDPNEIYNFIINH